MNVLGVFSVRRQFLSWNSRAAGAVRGDGVRPGRSPDARRSLPGSHHHVVLKSFCLAGNTVFRGELFFSTAARLIRPLNGCVYVYDFHTDECSRTRIISLWFRYGNYYSIVHLKF